MSEAHLSIIPDEPIPGIDPGGFHQTPNSMTIKAINANLTGADWKLWGYLQASDPHGDRMKTLKVAEIAKGIKISIRQFKRSIRKLEELGLYYSEPVELRGQNLAGKLAKEICQRKRESKSSDKNKMTDLPTTGQDRRVDDESAELMPDLPTTGQGCPTQPPEPLPQADSKTPQTSSDFSDLDQTLSEGNSRFSQFWNGLIKEEREKFETYCKAITANYQKPVVNIADWLAGQDKAGRNYWEVHYKEFKASEAAATPAADEASQAKQQELASRRKQAKEFLSEQNTDPDRDKKCVPAPQKSAAQPQETIEKVEVSNQSEEGAKEPKTEAKGFGVDPNLVAKLTAKNVQKKPQARKSRFVINEQEMNNARRDDEAAPPYD